jgi:hypothetical protein
MNTVDIFIEKKGRRMPNASQLRYYFIYVGSNSFERGANINLGGHFYLCVRMNSYLQPLN